jgi:hypothetical protein
MNTNGKGLEDLPVDAEQAAQVKGGAYDSFRSVIDPSNKSIVDPNVKSFIDPNN